MNELQQVLLVFAVVVVAGLYFLSRSRQVDSKGKSTSTSPQHQSSKALNELGNAHIPVSQVTHDRFTREDDADINYNQVSLSFGEGFDLPEPDPATAPEMILEESVEKDSEQSASPLKPTIEEASEQQQINDEARLASMNGKGGKHHVLIVEDPGMNLEDDRFIPPDHLKPKFGVPEKDIGKSPGVTSGEKQEYEVFVVLVMSTGHEFSMAELNHALLGVGLSVSEQSIYVKKDNMGNEIIKVANLLEPGIFPTEDLQKYGTPGIAMILELPSTVRAPAAMHDLIMMARKISQRLQGRLYNMERHLLKESDLQSMRDAAVNYESEPL
jgi:cell division protein ZipA